jgi:hypothetical protein
MMTCPKCGFEQETSPECIKCGIVIEKWLQKTRQNAFAKDESENTKQTLFETTTEPVPQNPISAIKGWFFGSKEHVLSHKAVCLKWLRTIRDEVVHLVLLLFIVWLLYSGLLYLCRALWYLYVETPIGHRFVSHYTSSSDHIFELLDLNLFVLSIGLIAVALKTCLVTGAVCKILSITRYFYLPAGLIARIFFWGFICSALTSYNVRNSFDMNWPTAFLLGLAPSLSVFGSCFEFTSELLPELSTILNIKTFEIIKSAKRLLTNKERRGKLGI